VLFGLGGGIVIVPRSSWPSGRAVPIHRRDVPRHRHPDGGRRPHPSRRGGTINGGSSRDWHRWCGGRRRGALAVNAVPALPCRIAFAAFLAVVVVRLVTGRRASAVRKPATTGFPTLRR